MRRQGNDVKNEIKYIVLKAATFWSCLVNIKAKQRGGHRFGKDWTRLNKNRRKAILTGLPRGDFFWGEGAAVRTQATITPRRRPLRHIESHVRVKHKLIWTLYPLEDFRNKNNEYHF